MLIKAVPVTQAIYIYNEDRVLPDSEHFNFHPLICKKITSQYIVRCIVQKWNS